MDTYSRDTVVIADIKVAWTEGKAIGFIPWSFFVKDESANRKEERTCFYQPFGFAPAPWRSIDEHPYPEATEADLYDARNGFGRWDYLKYLEKPTPTSTFEHQEAWEKWVKGDPELIQTVKERLIAAKLAPMYQDPEAPRLQLVPDWKSVITYDEYLAEQKRAEEDKERDAALEKIAGLCDSCSRGETLYQDVLRFFHRRNNAFVRCLAEDQHTWWGEKKETRWGIKRTPLFTKGLSERYQLLKGNLDDYGRTRSNKKLIRSHSAYRKLVDLGPEMVPFILKDLQEGAVGGIWTAEVLSELTGRTEDIKGWLSMAEILFGVLAFKLLAK